MAQKLTTKHLPVIIGALRDFVIAAMKLRFTNEEKNKLSELPTRAGLETLVRDIVDQKLQNK